MGMVIVSLLPLIAGAAILPLWVFVALLLLRSDRGVLKAAAFALGAMVVRVLQGFLFGYVFRAAGGPHEQVVIASTLLLVAGIVLLITAARTWLREVDPDAMPPAWTTRVSGVSAHAAFGGGALLMATALKQWVFTLSAIALIDEAQMSRTANVAAYLFFVVAAQSLVLAPVAACALAPARSAMLLAAVQGWLDRNTRAVTISVSLVFGLWFLRKGVVGLLESGHPAVGGAGAAARLG